MNATFQAVFIALQIAPLIAMGLTAPFVVAHYTRHRSLNVRWFTYLYIFVLYFLCAYFMTMLPLPDRDSLGDLRPVKEMIQLVPFRNFLDIRAETWLRDVAILVFNLFLTVPLGFFLRYLFRLPFKKVLLAGFLVAMLYELTQLSGLFFIYPRPYRFFDVDDLIINTLGAVVGWLCTPLAARLLPSPFESRRELVLGSEVAFPQRCVATAIDVCLVLLTVLLGITLIPPLKGLFAQSGPLRRFPLFYLVFIAVAALYALLLPEGTPGIRLTQLRLLGKGGRRISRMRCALRFVTICTSVIALPFWIRFFMTVNREYAGVRSILWVFLGAVFMMFAAAVLLEMLFNGVTHGASMFYDRFFGTCLAYGRNRRFSLFGIRVLDIQPLNAGNVDLFSARICQTLQAMGVSGESVTKARLMTEGVMLDWIENGLEGTPCELRLDKRFHRNVLMLSVSGADKTNAHLADSYAQMLRGLNLTVETYYAAEKNICNIQIP